MAVHIECLNRAVFRNKLLLGEEEGGGGEAGTNYRGPAVRKAARGPTVLHKVLSLSSLPLSVDCTNYPF
jgi:hypothetical protein